MSFDLAFWKPDGTAAVDPAAVYIALDEIEAGSGLDALAVADVKAHFLTAFPEIEDSGTELNWRGAGSYFQVTWPVSMTPGETFAVTVNCGWCLVKTPAVMERIKAVAFDLGCGVFDPQVDAWHTRKTPSKAPWWRFW